MSELILRILKVRCLDETGSGFFGELGDDDIYLAAVILDAAKSVKKIPAFKVGGFSDGDVKTFNPPKLLAKFNIPRNDFPARYLVRLVLIERDSGDNIEPFLDKLVNETKTAVEKADAATGNAPTTSSVWVQVLVEVGKEIATALWKSARKDDIFPPEDALISIPRKNFLWAGNKNNSPDFTAVFKAHNAHFQVTYDWQIV